MQIYDYDDDNDDDEEEDDDDDDDVLVDRRTQLICISDIYLLSWRW